MRRILLLVIIPFLYVAAAMAAEPAKPWDFSPQKLRPFWRSATMHNESVLFIDNGDGSRPKASLLFEPTQILSVCNSSGVTIYEQGRDYLWKPGSNEILLPPGSKIVCKTPQDLRRTPGSQQFRLTHRDGNGEILFGATHEYHDMQTVVTYAHKPDAWHGNCPFS